MEFVVQQGDVTSVASDLLVLKHAQGFYGADKAVAQLLMDAGRCTEKQVSPRPGEVVVVESQGAVRPTHVMFVGTPPLGEFHYEEMTQFAKLAVAMIVKLRLEAKIITTTVHGTGYGLDGGEALQCLIRGFRAEAERQSRVAIDRVMFLTLDSRSARMLGATLPRREEVASSVPPSLPGKTAATTDGTHPTTRPASPVSVSVTDVSTASKKRVFVAMPFSEEYQNVYEYGIYPAVRNCGLICERVDESHFTGDVLQRIRDGIESASLVIADLSEGRPNVYLEVGYAWGKEIPVILVAKRGQQLHFDVNAHRCIFYGLFNQFSKQLEALIRGIGVAPPEQ